MLSRAFLWCAEFRAIPRLPIYRDRKRIFFALAGAAKGPFAAAEITIARMIYHVGTEGHAATAINDVPIAFWRRRVRRRSMRNMALIAQSPGHGGSAR